MSGGVQAGAGQLVEGWGEQGAEGSAGAGVGEVDRVRSDSSPTVIASSFFSCAVLLIVCALTALVYCLVMVRVGRECSAVLTARLTCCILIYWPASISSIARAIACAWQDDSTLLIDHRIDQHPLEEHLVEQLLQVGGCGLVEAVAVFEAVKGLGEALVDFGYVGLVGGQLALNMVELGRPPGSVPP